MRANILRLLCVIVGMAAFAVANAREVAGVQLDDTIVVDGKPLVLNGAGIRERYFFDIYVGALYLPRRTADAAEALRVSGPKRVLLHFLYRHISKDKLADAWREGFMNNLDPPELAAVQSRMQAFMALFSDVKKNDVVVLDLLPGKGTRVTANQKQLGIIPGEDFQQALLKVWLGRSPPSEHLKAALLGRSD